MYISYICIYIIYICIYVYIYIYCKENNTELRIIEKSVFPTGFGCGHFQENSFSFEKRGVWLQKVLLDVRHC